MESQELGLEEFVDSIDPSFSRLLHEIFNGSNENENYEKLWFLLCDKVEDGDPAMKSNCLRLIEQLTIHSNIWPGNWTFYLVDLLFALYELILEDSANVDYGHDLLNTGTHLSSFMAEIGSLFQSNYERILKSPFAKAKPSKLVQWFECCLNAISHDSFVKLSLGIQRGLMEFVVGICCVLNACENHDVAPFGSRVAAAITKFCDCSFFRLGNGEHVSKLLGYFIDASAVACTCSVDNRDYYLCLGRYNKGNFGDTDSFRNMLADAVPFGDDDVSKLSSLLLTSVIRLRGLDLRLAFADCPGPIVRRLVQRLIRRVDSAPGDDSQTFIRLYFERAAALFWSCRAKGDVVSEDWLRDSIRHIVPALILSPCAESSTVLKAVSIFCGTNRQTLILENVCHVLVKVALKDLPSAELRGIYDFVETEGATVTNSVEQRLSFNHYVGCSSFLCVYELLLHLAASKERIVDMITQISILMGSSNGNDADPVKQVVEFVRPRLFGVLLKFTKKFTGRFPLDEKLLGLRSLIIFMEMCAGDVLSEISSTMLSTLRAAATVDDERMKIDMAKAWMVFFTNISLPVMKEMAVLVFVGVIPLVATNSNNEEKAIVGSLLRFMFEVKKVELQDQIADVAFLSKSISSSILPCMPFFDDSLHDLKDLLGIGLRLLTMEHSGVKCLSLKRLQSLLRSRLAEVNKLILEADDVGDTVQQLVSSLTQSLHHPDINVRRLAAICMGDLGAIDPGRLRAGSLVPSAAHDFAFLDLENVHSDAFPPVLLCEMTKLLLRSSDALYDVCSWMSQELLVFFKCPEQKDQENTSAYSIWSKLDDSTRKLLTPYLSTHYKVDAKPADSTPSQLNPLFGSAYGKTFKGWLAAWTCTLIAQVKHAKAKELLMVLQAGARVDINFAQFLLPQIVLCCLLEGEEQDRNKIRTEVMAALTGTIDSGQPLNEPHFERCSTHVVFSVLDFLIKWLTNVQSANRFELGRKHVQNFIDSVPKDVASVRAATFDAYPRSLMYYENYMENAGKRNSDPCSHFRRLQEIYAKMDDVDGVVGALVVLKRAGQGADKEQALALEATGNYTEALPFWEAAASSEHGDINEKMDTHLQLINCLLRLNQTGVCERYLSDLSRTSSNWENVLHPYRVEAMLKLQQWDDLEKELGNCAVVEHSWPSDLGHLLISARSRNANKFSECLNVARDRILEKLSVATRDKGTCDGGYGYLLHLQMLSEVEQGERYLFGSEDSTDEQLDNMLLLWDQRLKIVQPSTEVLYSLLDVRKQILRLGRPSEKSEKAVGACWLEAAKVARKTARYQSAWSFLVKAKGFGLIDTFVEEAKLLWNKDEKMEAIGCLKLGIKRHYSDLIQGCSGPDVPEERKFSLAKAQLLLANYCRESASMDTDSIARLYSGVIRVFPRWEEAYYYAALHYDQYLLSMGGANFRTNATSVNILMQIIECYAIALQYGSQYVHHAMPRLLTLWLDNTQPASVRTPTSSGSSKSADQGQQRTAEEVIQKLNDRVNQAICRIPIYQFYCCFSQLISRICHPCVSTYKILKEILSQLLAQYPRHCVWMTISVKRSSIVERSRRCREVFQHARGKNPNIEAIFASVDKLAELFIGVCERVIDPPTTTSMSMRRDFKQLNDYFKSGCSYKEQEVMLPLQSLMRVTYPQPTPGKSQNLNHSPFNERPVYIHQFLDAIEVFPTLQKPKKISLRGSDGQEYSLLCKARDDLRVDKRLMEFTDLVNGCMLRDAEARRRELHIRTYTVTPLNEKCGLLEWVPNLDAMRNVYLQLCREQGLKPPSLADLRAFQCKVDDPFEKKLKIFQQNLVPKHPLVLRNWFPRKFPDPIVWYRARTNFTRTAAVMSMVGFVLGLGDRHGENILLDRTCGDVVHVDFNCLFNRGESLEYPEIVPFRLTRNMVDAMGPLGFEGPFRKTCEVVMKLMRNEAGMLRTVLETFLHDPLVEWQQQGSRAGGARGEAKRLESGEEKAKAHLDNIDGRLRGRVKPSLREPYGLPLSVEGQVNVLIQQAVDEKLLAQMYLGWGPFL